MSTTNQNSGRDSLNVTTTSGTHQLPKWLITLLIVVILTILGVLNRGEALQLFGIQPAPAISEPTDDGQ